MRSATLLPFSELGLLLCCALLLLLLAPLAIARAAAFTLVLAVGDALASLLQVGLLA
jgi:dolichol kinase